VQVIFTSPSRPRAKGRTRSRVKRRPGDRRHLVLRPDGPPASPVLRLRDVVAHDHSGARPGELLRNAPPRRHIALTQRAEALKRHRLGRRRQWGRFFLSWRQRHAPSPSSMVGRGQQGRHVCERCRASDVLLESLRRCGAADELEGGGLYGGHADAGSRPRSMKASRSLRRKRRKRGPILLVHLHARDGAGDEMGVGMPGVAGPQPCTVGRRVLEPPRRRRSTAANTGPRSSTDGQLSSAPTPRAGGDASP